MLFLLHCYLDIPPRFRGSLCGQRRRWALTKFQISIVAALTEAGYAPQQRWGAAVFGALCQRQRVGQTLGLVLVSHSGTTPLLPEEPQNDQPFPMFCYARVMPGSDKAGTWVHEFSPLECQMTIRTVWILQTWKICPLAKGMHFLSLMVTIRMTRPDSSITCL